MFLKEIESRPATGIAGIALRKMSDEGRTIPDILHLFRFKTRTTNHLVRLTDEVMRGPSPLSPGLRELIGAYVSKKNQYSFCSLAHAAAAGEYMERDLVDEVLCDLDSSRLDPAHKELLRFLGKVVENRSGVAAADVDRVKAAGFSEEAIYDALTVASLFCFYNTWNAGAGVRAMNPAGYAYSGEVLKKRGYLMDFSFRSLLKVVASYRTDFDLRHFVKVTATTLRIILGGSRRAPGRCRPSEELSHTS
jgi:uncharacterized peroxidase-related enzyme